MLVKVVGQVLGRAEEGSRRSRGKEVNRERNETGNIANR